MSRREREYNSVWMYEYGDDTDPRDEDFNEEDLQNGIAECLVIDELCGGGSEINWDNLRIRTFREAGLLTNDKGLVITLPDGREYTVTIARRR